MSESEIIIVAIGGPTTGGKTETTHAISRIDKEVKVYPYDEHDLYPSGAPGLVGLMARGGPPHWESPDLFDGPEFVKNIRRWRLGLPIILPANSRESLAAGLTTREVFPGRINVVEGVHVLSFSEIIPLYDATFFIDISEEEMVRRRLARTPQGSTEPWDQEEYIRGAMVQGTRECVIPQRSLAQYVLDGTRPFDELAKEVLRIISKIDISASQA